MKFLIILHFNIRRNDFEKMASKHSRSRSTTHVPLHHEDETNTTEVTDLMPASNNNKHTRQSKSKEGTRKVHKVRKVKSEMKYIDPPQKDANKKKESKSDHEFANEFDVSLQFQREIYSILSLYIYK